MNCGVSSVRIERGVSHCLPITCNSPGRLEDPQDAFSSGAICTCTEPARGRQSAFATTRSTTSFSTGLGPKPSAAGGKAIL